jgi:hypothetical protein
MADGGCCDLLPAIVAQNFHIAITFCGSLRSFPAWKRPDDAIPYPRKKNEYADVELAQQ